MATNKRKDAAALFELIDKSSLKVPKNAGSLKIPSWWSSKTNTSPTPTPLTPTATAAPQAPAAPAPKETTPAAPLFNTSTSSTAPSIRAPGPAAAPKPVPVVAVPTARPAPAPLPVEPPRKPFAPATSDAVEHTSNSSSPFARVPLWAMVAGCAFLVLIIFLFAYSLMHKTPTTPANTSAAGPGVAQSNGQLIEGNTAPHADGPGADQSLLPPRNNNALVNSGNDAGPEPSRPGQVYEPGTLPRTANAYYIIVLHSTAESIARRNAKFIADNGVDVALEVTLKNGTTWWMITSVKGYPSMVAAEPDRKKIVAIGHLTHDYKTRHQAWDDAYVNQLKTVK